MRTLLFNAANQENALRALGTWIRTEKIEFDKMILVTGDSSDESTEVAKRMVSFDKRITQVTESVPIEELCDEVSRCDEITFDGKRFDITMMSTGEVLSGKIVLMPDVHGWAFDHIANQIKKHLGKKYIFRTIYHRDAVTNQDRLRSVLHDANAILIFWWRSNILFDSMIPKKCRRIIAVFDNFSYKGAGEEDFKKSASLAHLVIAGNEDIADQLSNIIPSSKIFVCEDGIDVSMFNPKMESDELVVGWAGNSKSDASLTGETDLKGFRSIIKPVCLELPFVKLVTRDISADEMVPISEMPIFYRDLDVYVNMSTSEGTPNPCLEALASGVPVISTRVGLMPKIVMDGINGHLIDRDKKALTESLKEMFDLKISHSKEFHEMKLAARRSVESSWSWEKKANQYDGAFETVFGSPKKNVTVPTTPITLKNCIPGRKKKLAIIVDTYGWAWDIASRELIAHLPDVDSKIFSIPDFLNHHENPEDYDAVLMYPWAAKQITDMLLPENTIICVAGGEQLMEPLLSTFKHNCGSFYMFGANNGKIKAQLESMYPNKTTVVLSHGVDLERFIGGEHPPEDFTVGWVGSVSRPLKRFSLAETVVQEAGVKLKVAGLVNGVPAYTHDQMPEFYKSISCLLVTSELEAHPLIVYEALATGIPVVTTDVGDVDETIVHGRNGFILPVDSPSTAFSDIIKKLKDDVELRTTIGRNARESAASMWQWSVIAKQYEAIFDLVKECNWRKLDELYSTNGRA